MAVRLQPIEEEVEGVIYERLDVSQIALLGSKDRVDEPKTRIAMHGLMRFPLQRVIVWSSEVAFAYADEDARLAPLPCDRRVDFITSLPSGAEIGLICQWGRNRQFFVYPLDGVPGSHIEEWAVRQNLTRRLVLDGG